MSWLFARASARFYSRHPWQMILAIAGIALGVAVHVGVDLASDSSSRAFELSAQTVRGNTTHRLLGVGARLPESVFVDIAMRHDLRAAPIIQDTVVLPDLNDRRLTLLGIDPISETGFRSFGSLESGPDVDFARLMAGPNTAVASGALLQELGLSLGSTITIAHGADRHQIEIVGRSADQSLNPEADPPLLVDISTAQELTGSIGTLSRIDLLLDDQAVETLRSSLPDGIVLVDATAEDAAFNELSRAFQTNIRALGLLALFVGMFLIYATISFTVVQRRSSLGVLRALGVTRAEILRAMLAEVLALGLLGTLIGVFVGIMLATSIVGLVLNTINDFYLTSQLSAVSPSHWIYVQGFALGICTSVIAALGPLRDACRSAPATTISRSVVEKVARKRSRLAGLLAPPLLLVAAMLLLIESRSLLMAFTGIFLVLGAAALATPVSTRWLTRALEPVAESCFGVTSVLALRNVRAHMSRTGVATAALAVAVSTVIGVGLMISSFRLSLIDWLDQTLTADVFVSFDQDNQGRDLTPGIGAITALENVAGVGRTRITRIPTAHGNLILRAIEADYVGWGLDFVDGDPGEIAPRLASENAVAISEPLAYRTGLTRGDILELPTASRPRAFRVAGVFRDYTTGGGAVVLSLDTYRQFWHDSIISGLGVIATPGADKRQLGVEVLDAIGRPPGARVRTAAYLQQISLRIFDQTFQITEVLRVLAAIVAFLGILSAVLAIQLERQREFAILRSIGFSPRDLSQLILSETSMLGLAAGLLAVPIGSVLAALLVYVINRRSFGWSMDMALTAEPIVVGVGLALGAAMLAAIFPALRISRSNLAAALNDE